MSDLSSTIQEKIDLKLIAEAQSLLLHQGKELSAEQYDSFHEQVSQSLHRADALVKKAKSAEQRGNVEEALNMLNQAKLIAADLPGLHHELLHMNDAVQLTRSFKTRALRRKTKNDQTEQKTKRSASFSVYLSIFFLIIIAAGAFYFFTTSHSPLETIVAAPVKLRSTAPRQETKQNDDENIEVSPPKKISIIDEQHQQAAQVATIAEQQPVIQNKKNTETADDRPAADTQPDLLAEESPDNQSLEEKSREQDDISIDSSPPETATITSGQQQPGQAEEVATTAEQQPVIQNKKNTETADDRPAADTQPDLLAEESPDNQSLEEKSREQDDISIDSSPPETTPITSKQQRPGQAEEVATTAEQQPVIQNKKNTETADDRPAADTQPDLLSEKSPDNQSLEEKSREQDDISIDSSPPETAPITSGQQQPGQAEEVATTAEQQPVIQNKKNTETADDRPAADTQPDLLAEASPDNQSLEEKSRELDDVSIDSSPPETATITSEQQQPVRKNNKTAESLDDTAAGDFSAADTHVDTPAEKNLVNETNVTASKPLQEHTSEADSLPQHNLLKQPQKQIVPGEDLDQKPQTHRAPVPKNQAPVVYIVKPGDSLSTIANTIFCNERGWVKLLLINQDIITDPKKIVPGTRISLHSETIKVENRCSGSN